MSVALKCLLIVIVCSIYSIEAKSSSGYLKSTSSIMDVFSKQNNCCITKMALFDCSIIWKLFASIDYDIPCESCGKPSETPTDQPGETSSDQPGETSSEQPTEKEEPIFGLPKGEEPNDDSNADQNEESPIVNITAAKKK